MLSDLWKKKNENSKNEMNVVSETDANKIFDAETEHGIVMPTKAYHFSPKLNNEMPLPENLVSYLPNAELILVTSYGDSIFSNGRRYYVGLDRAFSEGAFVQYRVDKGELDYHQCVRETFAHSFHPFIQRFTNDVVSCSENMLHSFCFRPVSYEVSKHALNVSFDGGYYDTGYKETSDYIKYEESYRDSYHDGGGSGSEEWQLYVTDIKKEQRELSHEIKLKGVTLPACKGYWQENDHLYLVEPWGIPGVFEYYCHKNECRSYDSDDESWTVGTRCPEEHYNKK